MYVAESYNQEDAILSNNSAILYHPLSCYYCPVEFYCISNSTLSGVGDLVLPDGSIIHSDSSGLSVERLPFSTLHIQVSNSLAATGLYTCKLPDSNGNTLETTIGLYNGTLGKLTCVSYLCVITIITIIPCIGPPSINVLRSGYTDLTMDADSPAFVEVDCYTMHFPPTTVTWKRDGMEIDLCSKHYQTEQIVVDRINSHYRNILLIQNVFDIIGNHTFTCEIQNSAGSTYHGVTIDLPGTVILS